MIWTYNGYTSTLHEARITIPASELLRTKYGVVYAIRKQIEIEGRIVASSRTNMLTTVSNLKTACSADFGDFTWRYGDTTESGESILNSNTLGGIKAGPLSFPEGDGGEMSTYRHYRFSLSFVQPVSGVGNVVVEFSETVEHENPEAVGDFDFIPLADQPWQLQLLYPFGVHRMTQQGTIVGLYGYVAPPPPIYTSSPPYKPALTRRSRGSARVYEGGVRMEFPLTYSYSFASNSPMLPEATPTDIF